MYLSILRASAEKARGVNGTAFWESKCPFQLSVKSTVGLEVVLGPDVVLQNDLVELAKNSGPEHFDREPFQLAGAPHFGTRFTKSERVAASTCTRSHSL